MIVSDQLPVISCRLSLSELAFDIAAFLPRPSLIMRWSSMAS